MKQGLPEAGHMAFFIKPFSVPLA